MLDPRSPGAERRARLPVARGGSGELSVSGVFCLSIMIIIMSTYYITNTYYVTVHYVIS